MSKDDVIALLKAQCEQAGGISRWAEQCTVSAAYVSDVLKGRRDPGKAILDPLGLERVVTYRRVQAVKASKS